MWPALREIGTENPFAAPVPAPGGGPWRCARRASREAGEESHGVEDTAHAAVETEVKPGSSPRTDSCDRGIRRSRARPGDAPRPAAHAKGPPNLLPPGRLARTVPGRDESPQPSSLG